MIDPLGVRSSCAAVTHAADHVRIDDESTSRLIDSLLAQPPSSGWDTALHYRAKGDRAEERTAMWLLVLDTLNFCFWGQGADPRQRWRVRWNGELVDGYTALVAALTMAVERGVPVLDAAWLAQVSDVEIAEILAPEEGHTEIPLLQQRAVNLRELGRVLLDFGPEPATAFIRTARESAIELVRQIVALLPSYRDTALAQWVDTGLPAHEVRFYKRAQILVGDLAGGLAGWPSAEFRDLDALTSFADYKVPQILRELGVLVYDDELSSMVDHRHRLLSGSRMEIEIRAATIVACDRIALAAREYGRQLSAAEIDWYLWSMSQHMPAGSRPYHLTVTQFY